MLRFLERPGKPMTEWTVMPISSLKVQLILPGNSFELVVRARGKPQQGQAAQDPGDEFLKSCYFINCEDAKVKERTRQAIGRETDAWKKAQLIESYVHRQMENRLGNSLIQAIYKETGFDPDKL